MSYPQVVRYIISLICTVGSKKRYRSRQVGPKIMAAAGATDRAGYLHELYAMLLGPNVDLQLSLLVDSRGLHDTTTTYTNLVIIISGLM